MKTLLCPKCRSEAQKVGFSGVESEYRPDHQRSSDSNPPYVHLKNLYACVECNHFLCMNLAHLSHLYIRGRGVSIFLYSVGTDVLRSALSGIICPFCKSKIEPKSIVGISLVLRNLLQTSNYTDFMGREMSGLATVRCKSCMNLSSRDILNQDILFLVDRSYLPSVVNDRSSRTTDLWSTDLRSENVLETKSISLSALAFYDARAKVLRSQPSSGKAMKKGLCPECGGETREIADGKSFCLDCDWDNLPVLGDMGS